MKVQPLIFIFSILMTSSAFGLTGGKIAKEVEKNGVFSIATHLLKNSQEDDVCTASKIGPNVILTAAHCVYADQKSFLFGFSTKTKNPESQFKGLEVIKIIQHPSYDASQDGLGDFGAKSIDAALVFVTPTKKFLELKTLEMDFKYVRAEDQIEIWGYGCQRGMSESYNYIPAKKHGFNTVLEKKSLGGNFGAATATVNKMVKGIYKNSFLSKGLNNFVDAQSLCWGDSGGPVLRSGKVVGINYSYLVQDFENDGSSKSGLTDLNLHVRLSAIEKWIKATIKSTTSM
jgi:secreted trypsin-like serine protease